VATHFGVQPDAAQVRPGPQLLPQPPQFLASLVGLIHFWLQAICGVGHASFTH
jgi:hypothetical protein